jgi:DNA-binding NtrC family response regulator
MNSRSIDLLLIEDDRVLGGALAQRLKLEGIDVRWAQTCGQAMVHLRRRRPDFVLADIRLPDGSGEELYRQALPYLGGTPIVFATAFADIQQAVRLVRAGADDYLTKPYDVDALMERLRGLLRTLRAPRREAPAALTSALRSVSRYFRIAADLERVARTDLPVLLLGETGAGKEVAAHMIHAQSSHAAHPFVAVNCGAIGRELMESQFFGHERGAFTGASSAHVGYFEETAEGTLFLDEIGELDARLQAGLLRVLNDGVFRRLGGRQDIVSGEGSCLRPMQTFKHPLPTRRSARIFTIGLRWWNSWCRLYANERKSSWNLPHVLPDKRAVALVGRYPRSMRVQSWRCSPTIGQAMSVNCAIGSSGQWRFQTLAP